MISRAEDWNLYLYINSPFVCLRQLLLVLLPLMATVTPADLAGFRSVDTLLQPRLVIVSFTPDYQSSDPGSDTIYYAAQRPLGWKDFQGKPTKLSEDAAVCYSSFGYIGKAMQHRDTIFVTVTLQVFFVKSASWVKPGEVDDYSLQHEQLHFDLTKIAAEYYRKTVLATPMHPDDYDSYLQYLFLDAFRYMNRLQDQYDTETRHGMDHRAQAMWDKKVEAEMKGY